MGRMELDRRRFLGWGALAIGLGAGTHAEDAGEQSPRIGVIGLGRRGFELFKRLAQMPGVTLSTVCDVWGPNLDKIRPFATAPMFTPHFGKVLLRSDAVLIAAPDHLHKSMCLMALSYERDVYLETPVTQFIEQGTELTAAAAKNNRIIQPGHQQVMNPINQKVRELLQSGQIGDIRRITGEVQIDGPTRVGYSPLPSNTALDSTRWGLFLGDLPERPYNPKHLFQWGLYWDYSCGLAGSEMVPLIATIHALTGTEAPVKVTARGQTEQWKELTDMPDHLSADLEYPQGWIVNLSVSSSGKNEGPSLVIHGSKGTIEYEPNWCKVYGESGEPTEYRVEGDPTELHLQAFVKAIKTRTPADLAFGIKAANVGHLINLSYKQGKTVGWDKAAGKAVV